jgi:hypothetical protein
MMIAAGYNSPPVLMSVVGPAVTRQPKPWSLCANKAARSGHAACFAPDSRLIRAPFFCRTGQRDQTADDLTVRL